MRRASQRKNLEAHLEPGPERSHRAGEPGRKTEKPASKPGREPAIPGYPPKLDMVYASMCFLDDNPTTLQQLFLKIAGKILKCLPPLVIIF
jgi:hypothetical protein